MLGAGREQPPSLLSGAVGIDKSVAEGVFWEWGVWSPSSALRANHRPDPGPLPKKTLTMSG